MSEQLPSDQVLSPGDVAVILPDPDSPSHALDYTECTIVSGPSFETGHDEYGDWVMWCFEVRLCDGEPGYVRPQYLRKKRLPREGIQLVRWDQCPWQPESINV